MWRRVEFKGPWAVLLTGLPSPDFVLSPQGHPGEARDHFGVTAYRCCGDNSSSPQAPQVIPAVPQVPAAAALIVA